ncbi:TonB family protein [bacterium]|nr:MAG: TonB family protein [bacterium]
MVTAIQTYKGESPTRVPSALALSVALHLAGLAAFLRISAAPPAEAPIQAIENVDLLVEEKEEAKKAEPARPKVAPPSMKDFLRLALPSVPKAMPKMLDAAVPLEDRRLMDMTPKLDDRGRIKEPEKLAALDMERKRPTLAKLDAALPEERRPTRTLAALPKLEEVGGRQAPRKAIEAANLLESDRGRMQRAPLGSMAELAAERRRPAQPAALLPSEARPATKPSALSKMADMLTSEENRISLSPRTAAAPRRETLSKMAESEPAPPPRRATEAQTVKKKAVEIEGPLSNRRVVGHSLPHFPDWAREMGLVEAEVSIRFYVSPEGAVLGDSMRVERTSGYGRLDRLAMDHLKVWKFQPKAIAGNEWGVITFRFLLE